jgi:hypothetical protein
MRAAGLRGGRRDRHQDGGDYGAGPVVVTSPSTPLDEEPLPFRTQERTNSIRNPSWVANRRTVPCLGPSSTRSVLTIPTTGQAQTRWPRETARQHVPALTTDKPLTTAITVKDPQDPA